MGRHTATASKIRHYLKDTETEAVFDRLFQPPRVEELDRLREIARHKRRIVYDCFKAKVVDSSDGVRVHCPLNILAPHHDDGSMDLRTVLRGGATKACQDCPFYDDEDSPTAATTKVAPVRTHQCRHPKVHMLDGRMPTLLATLCGRFCASWVAVEESKPVTCRKCLRQWQEIQEVK